MAQFISYHDITAVEHQARVDTLGPQGFRPISLNVSGDPTDARYAAVWVQRPGPAWVALRGFMAEQYQERFDELTGRGYAPTLLSVTGPVARASFTALFESDHQVPWFARHGLKWDPQSDPNTITHENQRALDQGFIPRCLVAYGTAQDRRFAGIWTRNEGPVAWSWWWADPDTYQLFFEAEVRGGMRPTWVAEADDGWILSVFRDDAVGLWWARHRLTAQEYQAESDARVGDGAMPITVQAAGTGATRYAALFARRESPQPRAWTAVGRHVAGMSQLDAIVRGFMQAHGIRAGGVAVGRRGRVVLARGFTWAEADYPITSTSSLFRVASLSKIFTAACIKTLIAAGRLMLSTQAFPFLGIVTALVPGQTPDPRTATITVEQLLLRTSGLRRDWDGGNDLRSVATRLGIATTPTRDQLTRYIYGEPLLFTPGTADQYSNVAFTVLTSVVEAASGRPYLDYLRRNVLQRERIADVYVAATPHMGTWPGEAPGYDHPGVGLSLLAPAAEVWEPNAYGGDFILENGEGSGGLVTSARTIARFIARHAVWNAGGRELATRYGTLDGTISGAVSRSDNLDLGYVFNRRVTDAEHDQITTEINGYLDAHGAALR